MILTGNFNKYIDRIESYNEELERFVDISKSLVYDSYAHKELVAIRKKLVADINSDDSISDADKKLMLSMINEFLAIQSDEIKP